MTLISMQCLCCTHLLERIHVPVNGVVQCLTAHNEDIVGRDDLRGHNNAWTTLGWQRTHEQDDCLASAVFQRRMALVVLAEIAQFALRHLVPPRLWSRFGDSFETFPDVAPSASLGFNGCNGTHRWM